MSKHRQMSTGVRGKRTRIERHVDGNDIRRGEEFLFGRNKLDPSGISTFLGQIRRPGLDIQIECLCNLDVLCIHRPHAR